MTRKAKPPVSAYSALADATRCRIIEILLAGALPVHQLSDAFSISRPAISRHLRVLKQAGLVAEVKKGRENLYALKPDRLVKATTWIEVLLSQKPQAASRPKVEAKPQEVAVQPVPEPKARINQMGFDF